MSSSDIVNGWFAEKIACGAVARDTEAYNQVAAALPDLIARLDGPAPVAQETDEAAPAPKSPAPDTASGKKG